MERKTINHATMETLTHPNRMFPLSEFVDQFDTFPDGGFPSHWHEELDCRSFSPEASVTG